MKQTIHLHELFNFLSKQGFYTSNEIYSKFEKYLSLIRSWSKRTNLISKNDIDFVVEKHFLPSIFLFSEIKNNNHKKILDIGSGGGFPGIVLMIMNSDFMITLLDSSHKKCMFLKELSETIEINCDVICMRVEDYINESDEKYDITVSRAVSKLSSLWEWSGPLLKNDGLLYALKGGNCLKEINVLTQRPISTEIIYPGKKWIEFSKYLKTKFIVRARCNKLK